MLGQSWIADAQTDYEYDSAGRVTKITQKDGGDTNGEDVQHKRVDFDYNDINQWTSIDRYEDLTGTNLVANSTYTYDTGHRLTEVHFYNASDVLQKSVVYTYDALNQRIQRDSGSADYESEEWYAHDAAGKRGGVTDVPLDDIIMSFDKDGDLLHRYLHGPGIDQVLASEDLAGEILWALSDHQGSVRDLVSWTGSAAVAEMHRQYNSFGEIVSTTGNISTFLFAYTGRLLDVDTFKQNNRERWYDSKIGRWKSEDPIGFKAGDWNLGRYAGNSPLISADPSGQDYLLVPGRNTAHYRNENKQQVKIGTVISEGEGLLKREYIYLYPKYGGVLITKQQIEKMAGAYTRSKFESKSQLMDRLSRSLPSAAHSRNLSVCERELLKVVFKEGLESVYSGFSELDNFENIIAMRLQDLKVYNSSNSMGISYPKFDRTDNDISGIAASTFALNGKVAAMGIGKFVMYRDRFPRVGNVADFPLLGHGSWHAVHAAFTGGNNEYAFLSAYVLNSACHKAVGRNGYRANYSEILSCAFQNTLEAILKKHPDVLNSCCLNGKSLKQNFPGIAKDVRVQFKSDYDAQVKKYVR